MPFEEVWIRRFESASSETLIVNTSSGIELKELAAHGEEETKGRPPGELEGHEGESVTDAHKEELDPHIWTSPANAKIMVENIYEGLVIIDPENKEYYAQNRDAYLKDLDAWMQNPGKTRGKKRKEFHGFHPSWGYFAAEYGLTMITIETEGKRTEALRTWRKLWTLQRKQVRVIFVQPQFSTRSAQAVAEEIDVEVIAVDPLAKDYIKNMDRVSDVLPETL